MVNVLVVEDEDSLRAEIIDWLSFEGYQPFGASNGAEALEIASLHRPDIVISDITMPIMDGYELLLEVRSDPALSDVPFIFTTASGERSAIRHGMNLGADDYIIKPFSNAELLASVTARLEKHKQQNTHAQRQLETLRLALENEREHRTLRSRLVGMFSHDFRNPLASIMSSADLLIHYGDHLEPERRKAKLRRIATAVQQLTHMLDEMLMVAEMGSSQYEYTARQVNIADLISTIIDEFRNTDLSAHEFSFDSTLHDKILIDPKLVRQIVTNLLSNACKYSPEQTEIAIQLTTHGQMLEMCIKDYGIGIPATSLAQLFEPFFRADNTTNIQGTGLGLAIVKQAVDLAEGTITVDSEINVGSTFTVRLPYQPL